MPAHSASPGLVLDSPDSHVSFFGAHRTMTTAARAAGTAPVLPVRKRTASRSPSPSIEEGNHTRGDSRDGDPDRAGCFKQRCRPARAGRARSSASTLAVFRLVVVSFAREL